MIAVSGNWTAVNNLQGQALIRTLVFMLDSGITLTSVPVSTGKRLQE